MAQDLLMRTVKTDHTWQMTVRTTHVVGFVVLGLTFQE